MKTIKPKRRCVVCVPDTSGMRCSYCQMPIKKIVEIKEFVEKGVYWVE